MNMLSSINQDLMVTYGVNATHLGMLSSYYFLANLIFLLPAGQLLDRFSVRTLIVLAMSVCIMGTIVFAFTTEFWVAALCRFLTGIGSAFCFLGSIRIASRWFPPAKMAFVSGIIVTMAMIGGWIAQTPMSLLVAATNWRTALFVDAAIGVVFLLLIVIIVRDYPPGGAKLYQREHDQLHKQGLCQSIRQTYFRKQNWMGGIYTSMMNLPLFLLGGLWGSLYLAQVLGYDRSQASSITGMIFLGTVIGSPLAGLLSDKMGRRKTPMLIGAVISFLLMMVLIYYPAMSYPALLFTFFLLGLITSTQVISYPTITESNSHALTASAVSVISLCAISGGAIFEPLYGWLMDLGWIGNIQNGMHVYSHSDFHRAMFIMPVGIVVAFIAAMNLKETYCQQQDKE
jgi:MFS family permease